MLGRMARPRFFVLLLLASSACDSGQGVISKPPPLPPFPSVSAKAPPVVPPVEEALPEKAHPARTAPETTRGSAPNRAAKHPSEAPPVKPVAAAKPAAAPKSAPASPKAPPPAPAPQAPLVATTPKPAAASKVSVPKTVHVQIDVPAGLQADLDHDPRMQPWVNQVVATIDRCYGSESKSNTKLSGTIEVLVTMHENERPDADIKQLPPALSPIVACATGGLMRTKMPLFTGKESSRYSVRLRFVP
jgi:hypothetical protein